ncbi:MAG: LysR substrate-binding domain-containing protein [Marinobacter sp.]
MQNHSWVRRIKLQQLRVVVFVAQSRSLTSAANEMALSQPAITKILHELETDLEAQLFIRTSRGTHPTKLGEQIAERAQAIFAQLDQLAQEISDRQSGLSGHVAVGVLLAGGANILPRAVAALHRRSPNVRVTIVEGTYETLIPQLRQGALDFIVGRLPAYKYRERLETIPLFQEKIAFVVRPGHPLLEHRHLTIEDLKDWPWIMPLPDTTLRTMLEAEFHERSLDLPVIACESLSIVTNRRMIMDTNYVGAFPAQVVQPDISANLLSKLPMKDTLSFGPVGITQTKGNQLGIAARVLADELKAHNDS